LSVYRLNEVLGALSLATDSANGVPPETALRTALVAVSIGRAAGFDEETLRDAYYAALLRFLGCTAFAYETAGRYGAGDDRAVLGAALAADTSKPIDVARRIVTGIANAPLGRRAAALARLTFDPDPTHALARAHCELAMTLATRLGVPPAVVVSLGQIYERFDGRGDPHGLSGDGIEASARLAAIAFRVVISQTLERETGSLDVVQKRSGTELDPILAEVVSINAGAIGDLLRGPAVWDLFLDAEPGRPLTIPATELDRVAQAFADYSDLKSPFTIGHSPSVAALAKDVGRELQLSTEDCSTLYTAALLHDLGRVAIANGIWDKPGKLSPGERSLVETHAWHTTRILQRTPLLASFASLAGQAHAHVDGSGYTGGPLPAAEVAKARILAACDVYRALKEDRPHRKALNPDSVSRTLLEEVACGRLDANIVDAILSNDGVRMKRPDLPAGLSEREAQVLRLVANGLSNKEIASRLEISAKTVQHHVAHIYEKTGIRTRASAAIYAMTQGLLVP